MAKIKHLQILKQGVEAWNKWRKENPKIIPDLEKADLWGADLFEANLRGADLRGAHLIDADLRGANLDKAKLSGINLTLANLQSAKLNGADLREANLREANLIDADLREANLREANLIDAELNIADLIGTHLSKANLSGANLTGADLSRADFYSTKLNRASLRKADLIRADLSEADLSGADLSGAKLFETHFANTNLLNTKNLDKCDHKGPSNIDFRTFVKSGNLPIKFLRGCGLSDWQIEATKLYNPKLRTNQIIDIQQRVFELRTGKPIQMTNLFISYSHADEKFVEHLEDFLEDRRVLYWRDVHHAPAGPLEEIVVRAMRDNPAVLLILSEHSVESDWVEYEAKKARELEKELGRHVLCPVALDDSWKTCRWEEKLRMQIKKYNILDFSNWQNDDNFEAKFNRLLEGLKLYYKPEDKESD